MTQGGSVPLRNGCQNTRKQAAGGSDTVAREAWTDLLARSTDTSATARIANKTESATTAIRQAQEAPAGAAGGTGRSATASWPGLPLAAVRRWNCREYEPRGNSMMTASFEPVEV